MTSNFSVRTLTECDTRATQSRGSINMNTPMSTENELHSSFIPSSKSPVLDSRSASLHDAAERGDAKTVLSLINFGRIDLDTYSGGHRVLRTPLHRAAGYGHLEVVKILLKVG